MLLLTMRVMTIQIIAVFHLPHHPPPGKYFSLKSLTSEATHSENHIFQKGLTKLAILSDYKCPV